MTPVPQQAGPSAAVIAGIVAVAVFILIVTVILLLRYFMSHKGIVAVIIAYLEHFLLISKIAEPASQFYPTHITAVILILFLLAPFEMIKIPLPKLSLKTKK